MAAPQFAVGALTSAPLPGDAAAIVEEIGVLETLKCAAEARQARLASALDGIRHQEAEEAEESEEPEKSEQVVVATHAEVALARRVSPHRGRQFLSLARILGRELPHTKAAFDAGLISQWRAMLIARETACLPAEHRARVDEIIAADPVELSGRGDRETTVLVRQLAVRLDAAAVARRRRHAEADRRVSLRPAPDAMVYLTALLPVAQGVGLYAALKKAAGTAVGIGDATSHGAAMADELIRRVTGQAGAPPVALRLTMSSDALLDHADDPAFLSDHGPIPAEAARALVADNLQAGAKVWLKRLFVRPESRELIAMDSHARRFPKALAEFLDLRDRWCRTPWCDAPIRHHDHIQPHATGGKTNITNGQGLCVTCNQAKQAPGWKSTVIPGLRHTVVTTTPAGHHYQSRAPAA
jgi:hypothetical protein